MNHYRNDIQSKSLSNHIQTKFFPGAIHKEEVRHFWQTELKASDWVMQVLEKGYVIPLTQLPTVYEEPNNASANLENNFVKEAVAELERLGTIKYVYEKPHCVSPLSVTKKIGSDGSVKKRLCWDGLRCVNKYIKEQKVTLSHFQRALEITRKSDFQVTYDLKSAYQVIII